MTLRLLLGIGRRRLVLHSSMRPLSTASNREVPKLKRSQSFKVGSEASDEDGEGPDKRHGKVEDESHGSPRTVIITGAAGNLGRKAATHLLGSKNQKYNLILMDAAPCPKEFQEKKQSGNSFEYINADFTKFDSSWVQKLKSAFACVMFAAQNPQPDASAQDAFRSMMINSNLLEACAAGKTERIIFASSNHVMGGLLHHEAQEKIAANAKPVVGTQYHIPEATMDSTLYASAKAAAEAQVKAMVESGRLARAIVLRIGFCQSGANEKRSLSVTGKSDSGTSNKKQNVGKGEEETRVMNWWKGMYLSNEDFVKMIDRCLASDLNKNTKNILYANGVSANPGSRWSFENDICYQPTQQSP